MLRRSLALGAALCSTVLAQSQVAVGSRAIVLANSTGVGSTALAATVRYPAATAGTDVPVLPHPSGWPVIVLLHGFGWLGQDYTVLADAYVGQGFVVVLPDTCQWDWDCQEYDARAIYPALATENASAASPFGGALDMSRVGLVGHSMGGMSVGNVLAINPGYAAGLAIAPVLPFGDSPQAIAVPFGTIVGAGDPITPWDGFSLPYYTAVVNHPTLKFLCVMGMACEHMNVAGLVAQPSAVDASVFTRGVRSGIGFLQHAMGLDATGLDRAIGFEAAADPLVALLESDIATPQVWLDQQFRIGMSSRVCSAAPGTWSILFAATTVIPPLATAWGDLLIDPWTMFPLAVLIAPPGDVAGATIAVPADPNLVGLPVALQALGETLPQVSWLSNAWQVQILP